MVTEEQVRALFKNANPVPDAGLVTTDVIGASAQLDAILERSGEAGENDVEWDEDAGDRRRLTPWLVAALVIVLIGTVALLARQRPVDTPVATDPTVSTPTTQPTSSLNSGLANVEAFMSAFNDHDAVGIDLVSEPGFSLTTYHELLFAMDARWEVVEPCSVRGSNPRVIECKVSVTDRFFGPGGLDHTAAILFSIDDQGRVTNWRDLGCCERQSDYVDDFWAWLSTAHPDVYVELSRSTGLAVPESLPGWAGQPSEMTTALTYVDEFVQATHWVFPEGQYRAVRSSEQLLAAGMAEADVPFHAGTWTLTFRDGELTLVDTIGGRCDGTYSVEGGRVSLLLGQDAGCGTAQGQVLFSAAWEESGSGIRFIDLQIDADPTEQLLRNAIFSEVVWTKVG